MTAHTQDLDGVRLELTVGDVVAQADVDAVVNAANAQLQTGGGVAGAIHRAAGPGLAEECRPLAPISPGQAVITSGHGLPNAHVVHVLGPVYGRDEPADELLADAYRNAMLLAEREELASIAFPAVSTGAFGFPMQSAARIAMQTVVHVAPRLDHLRLVRFVFTDDRTLQVHRDALVEVVDAA